MSDLLSFWWRLADRGNFQQSSLIETARASNDSRVVFLKVDDGMIETKGLQLTRRAGGLNDSQPLNASRSKLSELFEENDSQNPPWRAAGTSQPCYEPTI